MVNVESQFWVCQECQKYLEVGQREVKGSLDEQKIIFCADIFIFHVNTHLALLSCIKHMQAL